MAELCLGLATSHLTHIIDARDQAEPAQLEAFDRGYERLAEEFRKARLDAAIIISAEHVNQFFLDAMPPFCIGVFDAFSGPIEARSRKMQMPYRTVQSDIELSRHLLERGLDEGVDWAFCESWEVDHGMMVPLYLLDREAEIPVTPVFVNCAVPPLPTPRRCFAVGQWLATAIRAWPADKRVAIIATGGLSHSVGTPDQGRIDVEFDERLLTALCDGNGEALSRLTDAEIDAAGSSTGEVRSWIMLAGAFAGRPAERVFYAPIEGFVTGCAQCIIR